MLFQLEALHNNIRTTVVVTTKHVEVPNNRIELITLIKNDKGGGQKISYTPSALFVANAKKTSWKTVVPATEICLEGF